MAAPRWVSVAVLISRFELTKGCRNKIKKPYNWLARRCLREPLVPSPKAPVSGGQTIKLGYSEEAVEFWSRRLAGRRRVRSPCAGDVGGSPCPALKDPVLPGAQAGKIGLGGRCLRRPQRPITSQETEGAATLASLTQKRKQPLFCSIVAGLEHRRDRR